MIITPSLSLAEIADTLTRMERPELAWFAKELGRIAVGEPLSSSDAPAAAPSCAVARQRLDELRRIWPDASRRVIAVAEAAGEQYGPQALLSILKAALFLNPLWLSDLTPLQNAVVVKGGLADLLALLEAVDARQPFIPLDMLPLAGTAGIEAARRQKLRRARAGVPGVLLNTLPKTGSMFLAEVLRRNLDLPWSTIAIPDHALRDRPVRPWLRRFAEGGVLAQEHLPGTVETRAALLACGVDRIIVHLRDPRQAMLSTLHHFTKEYDMAAAIFTPWLPRGFPDLSFDERAAFLIENYFPEQMAWIEGWVEAADSHSSLKILFSHYEESVSNPLEFLRRTVNFYGISQDILASAVDIPPSKDLHFRRGLKEEWREAFSPSHLERMRALIPTALIARFGWPE